MMKVGRLVFILHVLLGVTFQMVTRREVWGGYTSWTFLLVKSGLEKCDRTH